MLFLGYVLLFFWHYKKSDLLAHEIFPHPILVNEKIKFVFIKWNRVGYYLKIDKFLAIYNTRIMAFPWTINCRSTYSGVKGVGRAPGKMILPSPQIMKSSPPPLKRYIYNFQLTPAVVMFLQNFFWLLIEWDSRNSIASWKFRLYVYLKFSFFTHPVAFDERYVQLDFFLIKNKYFSDNS